MKREEESKKKPPPQARAVVIFLSVFLVLLTRVEGCVLLTPDEVRLAAALQPQPSVHPSARPSNQRVLVLLFFLPLGRKLVEVLYSLRLSLLLLSTDGRVCVFFPECVCGHQF